jgi:hypothetical protein
MGCGYGKLIRVLIRDLWVYVLFHTADTADMAGKSPLAVSVVSRKAAKFEKAKAQKKFPPCTPCDLRVLCEKQKTVFVKILRIYKIIHSSY